MNTQELTPMESYSKAAKNRAALAFAAAFIINIATGFFKAKIVMEGGNAAQIVSLSLLAVIVIALSVISAGNYDLHKRIKGGAK